MFSKFMSAWRSKALLSQALERAEKMLTSVAKSHRLVIGCLVEGSKCEIDIYARDRYINHMSREVRRLVAEHLVLNPKHDTVAALVLLNVDIDIERCGDFTKNIMELSEHYNRPFTESMGYEVLSELEALVSEDFDLTHKAFVESDETAAARVLENHIVVSTKSDGLIEKLFYFEEKLDPRDAIFCTLLSRYLKRINAHLMNVASTVINPFDWVSYQYDGDPADAKELD